MVCLPALVIGYCMLATGIASAGYFQRYVEYLFLYDGIPCFVYRWQFAGNIEKIINE